MRLAAAALASLIVAGACGVRETVFNTPPPRAEVTQSASPAATAAPTATPAPTPTPSPSPSPSPVPVATIAQVIDRIDQSKLDAHLVALTSVRSRDPRHPGHALAIAYLKEQLAAVPGVQVSSHVAMYQGIRLENILATIDPPSGAPANGWILISAHYDTTANRTPGWRPSIDPAPGADDNATGTAALLEYARIIAADRAALKQRIVLAFFDGEELFFKGSAAYVAQLPRPYPYAAALNIDMVGFNPIADRLDLLWYTNASAGLRDRVIAANQRYAIGVAPLVAQFAADGNTIMDAAPFGLAGIPSIALCQRYGGNDATFPGNYTFHTTADTPDKITNKRLWMKAAKLTLATALELARGG